jgi:hypothetical protein
MPCGGAELPPVPPARLDRMPLGGVLALEPTANELAECQPWLEQQDGNELWPKHVRDTLASLGKKLNHGV